MRTLLLVVVFLSALVSCTSSTPTPNPGGPISGVVCALESSVASGFATSIGSALSCTNVSQIQTDILGKLGSANLCPAATPGVKAQSVIGSIVCPIAVQSAMALVATKIPAAWGCSPNASTATLSTALTATCVAAVGGI